MQDLQITQSSRHHRHLGPPMGGSMAGDVSRLPPGRPRHADHRPRRQRRGGAPGRAADRDGARRRPGMGTRAQPSSSAAWIAATGLGLMVGLGIGAAVVDYDTSLTALVIQGAISGLVVGVAQGFVLLPRLGRVALVWPPALAAIWAAGWATTTNIGIDVDQQFTIFGSSGALVATVLTAVLPLVLNRNAAANRNNDERQ